MQALKQLTEFLEDKVETYESQYEFVIQSHEKLPSPYFLYHELLLSLTKQPSDLKDALKRHLIAKLPEFTLETENLMDWIRRLEYAKMLSIDDLSFIKEVLKSERMMLLFWDFTHFEHKMKVIRILSHDLMCQREKNIDLFDKEKSCFAGRPSYMLSTRFKENLKVIQMSNVKDIDKLLRDVRQDLVQYSKTHDNEDVAYNCMFLSQRIMEKFGKLLVETNQTVNIPADDKKIPGTMERLNFWFVSIILNVCKSLSKLSGSVIMLMFLLFCLVIIQIFEKDRARDF